MPSRHLPDILSHAVRNNALWCDLMCRAHGVPGEFTPDAWFNRHRVPPFHSNVITLTGAARAQLDLIRSLADTTPSACGGVKDSLACLDLAPLGFEPLFEADWICRPAGRPPGVRTGDRLSWSRVRDGSGLEAWEKTWRADDANSTRHARLFLPALLDDPDVAFLSGHADGAIMAVAIANRTGDVVGLSNVFSVDPACDEHWRGCLLATTGLFPGLAVVGYERGRDLAAARDVGFEPIHPLRVWVKST